MTIPATEVRKMLKDKRIAFLFHSNTVLTTLSYLKEGGILSRGAVEDRGLPQIAQCTDEKDKQLGIWNDIFFDSVDVHERAKELNKYGPLTLVFDPDLLLIDGLNIHITRDNPIRWDTGTPNNERYFENIESLYAEYKKGAFCQHLTIRNMKEPIPFDPYLLKVVIDNPQLKSNECFEEASKILKSIIKSKCPNTDFIIRKCSHKCKCKAQYENFKKESIWYKYRTKQ